MEETGWRSNWLMLTGPDLSRGSDTLIVNCFGSLDYRIKKKTKFALRISNSFGLNFKLIKKPFVCNLGR